MSAGQEKQEREREREIKEKLENDIEEREEDRALSKEIITRNHSAWPLSLASKRTNRGPRRAATAVHVHLFAAALHRVRNRLKFQSWLRSMVLFRKSLHRAIRSANSTDMRVNESPNTIGGLYASDKSNNQRAGRVRRRTHTYTYTHTLSLSFSFLRAWPLQADTILRG